MIDPFTAIILASSALGANVAHNKDQNVLEGALKGAAIGATLGAPFFASGIGAGGAGTGNVLAQGVNAATAAPTTALPALSGQATLNAAIQGKGVEASAAAAQQASINKAFESGLANTARSGGPFSRLLATAKDKPLETARFASMVGGQLSPPPPPPAGGAPFNPGGVQPTPTVDETIGEMPVFVPKPLFDDMMGRSPEEMILLEEEMMARGLV